MAFIFIVSICILLYFSLSWIWRKRQNRNQSITFDNLILLVMTYAIVLMGFGSVYLILEIEGMQVLVEAGQSIRGTYFQLFETAMYFSAATLLSVGYGDVAPIGIGRWIVIVESLIGYTLPAAFVVRTVIDYDQKR
jgi:potassium channel LctB